jgi:hypothetical protein
LRIVWSRIISDWKKSPPRSDAAPVAMKSHCVRGYEDWRRVIDEITVAI